MVVSEFNNDLKNILGSPYKIVHDSEKENEKEFRRGVFLNKRIAKGDIIRIKILYFLDLKLDYLFGIIKI